MMTSLFRYLPCLPVLGLTLLLAGFVLPAPSWAAAGLELKPSHQWLNDPAGNLTPLETLAKTEHWQSGRHDAVNQGYVDHPVWLRFEVEQTTVGGEAYFEVGNAFLDRVELYQVQWQGGEPHIIAYQQAGDHTDFSQRFLNGRYPLFALTFPEPGRYSLLLRVDTRSTLMFPVSLQPPQQFYLSELRNQTYYGLYFGMLMVLAYFNLMLLIYVREKTFLHNLLFVASIGFYQAGLSGFGNGYLWFGNATINDLVLVVSATCSFFFGGRFALRFMELKVRAPRLYRLGSLLISSFLAVLVLAFLVSERTLVAVLQGVGIITAGYAFFVMIQQSLRGNDWARYLLLGWSTTITGYCLFILAMLDVLEYNGTILFMQA
ncbi:MAG TPA: 7TM diverse intracellular signaling domain-containing protein, partial [Dongiaceae bacterium]|nr:7TM diverse intracellular signaling domain-containing protein [Dongiaceae bacterium]